MAEVQRRVEGLSQLSAEYQSIMRKLVAPHPHAAPGCRGPDRHAEGAGREGRRSTARSSSPASAPISRSGPPPGSPKKRPGSKPRTRGATYERHAAASSRRQPPPRAISRSCWPRCWRRSRRATAPPICDGTFGGGGYAGGDPRRPPHCTLCAIDRDPGRDRPRRRAGRALPGRLHLLEGRFGDMLALLAAAGRRGARRRGARSRRLLLPDRRGRARLLLPRRRAA